VAAGLIVAASIRQPTVAASERETQAGSGSAAYNGKGS
jgi:hypothetical protein